MPWQGLPYTLRHTEIYGVFLLSAVRSNHSYAWEILMKFLVSCAALLVLLSQTGFALTPYGPVPSNVRVVGSGICSDISGTFPALLYFEVNGSTYNYVNLSLQLQGTTTPLHYSYWTFDAPMSSTPTASATDPIIFGTATTYSATFNSAAKPFNVSDFFSDLVVTADGCTLTMTFVNEAGFL